MRLLAAFLVITLTFNLFVQAYPAAHVRDEEKNQQQNGELSSDIAAETSYLHSRRLTLSINISSTGPRLIPRQAAAVAKAKRGYKAISTLEDKLTIAAIAGTSLITLLGAGLVGLRAVDHKACMFVQRQEEIMQKSWDETHPDGFVPNGDGLRPITFDCNVRERKFKPLASYANAAQYF